MFSTERTYKDIEDSRNTRLWITDVILPVLGIAAFVYTNEGARNDIKRLVGTAKQKVNNKITEFKAKKGVNNEFEKYREERIRELRDAIG